MFPNPLTQYRTMGLSSELRDTILLQSSTLASKVRIVAWDMMMKKLTLQSAEEVADSSNKHFPNPTYIDGKVVQPWYYNTVAEVITSVLHTSTGCAVLYIHNKAIFLKVSAQKDDL